MNRPAPYPPDTRAKGWRFELDYERIDQSDTVGLAASMALEGLPLGRPLLLAMWYAAWKQSPCGSMPVEERLIAGAIGIPMSVFAEYRDLLMRGWWTAEDGRMYHPTMTERVMEMVEYRRKNAVRVANFKAAKREQHYGNALPAREQQVKNDTGTGTGTGTSNTKPPSPNGDAPSAPRGAVGVYPEAFEQAWIAYPSRSGQSKAGALKAWQARIKAGDTPEAMTEGVRRYADYCEVTKTEQRFIKHAATFFGPDRHFLTDWTPPQQTPQGGMRQPPPNRYAGAAAAIFGHGDDRQGSMIDV